MSVVARSVFLALSPVRPRSWAAARFAGVGVAACVLLESPLLPATAQEVRRLRFYFAPPTPLAISWQGSQAATAVVLNNSTRSDFRQRQRALGSELEKHELYSTPFGPEAPTYKEIESQSEELESSPALWTAQAASLGDLGAALRDAEREATAIPEELRRPSTKTGRPKALVSSCSLLESRELPSVSAD